VRALSLSVARAARFDARSERRARPLPRRLIVSARAEWRKGTHPVPARTPSLDGATVEFG